jgi:zinc protease
VPTPAEQVERLKAVTLDQVKEVYAWIGAGAGEVAVVGAFDPMQVTESITKLSAAWQGTKPYQRITKPYKDAEPATLVLSTPDKASAMFALGMPLQVRDDDPDYPALAIGNFILGGSLNSRLMNRLRQKEGFSYGCGSALGASQFEASGTFLAFAMCAPQNTMKALAATREEIDRFLKDGITEQELNDARKGYRDQQSVMMAQDFILATMLCTNEQTNRTMQFAQTLMDRIAAVKPADVARVFEKHIVPDEFITVRAGDFKEATDQ